MAEMPFSGHVEKMRGFESKYRRRVGDWRIVFDVYSVERLVRVTAIERRTTTTYRRS
jgi:mRNA-degrading endonuclease RelE of RelBE toxin-antitoxin system